MNKLRSFYDSDRIEKISLPTNYRTQRNQHEIYCGMCGELYYVDDIFFDRLTRKIAETSDNPFICEECLTEYNELSHGH